VKRPTSRRLVSVIAILLAAVTAGVFLSSGDAAETSAAVDLEPLPPTDDAPQTAVFALG
jgi:hypothetical protein